MIDSDWDLGVKRRPRTEEWLNKKISWLNWHLKRKHWHRMEPGVHHKFMETAVFYSFPVYKEGEDIQHVLDEHRNYERRVRRCIRMAKLHNRYLSEWMRVTGIIIN